MSPEETRLHPSLLARAGSPCLSWTPPHGQLREGLLYLFTATSETYLEKEILVTTEIWGN